MRCKVCRDCTKKYPPVIGEGIFLLQFGPDAGIPGIIIEI